MIAAIFLPFLVPVVPCLIRTDMLDVICSSSVVYCAPEEAMLGEADTLVSHTGGGNAG